MHLIDHVASAAALATLVGWKRPQWLGFVAASTLIDLDHFPGAGRRYGLRSPLQGAQYALSGRVPGWAPNDPRYPLRVRRPLHKTQVALALVGLALVSRRARPLALGVIWHLLLDLTQMLTWRRPLPASADSQAAAESRAHLDK